MVNNNRTILSLHYDDDSLEKYNDMFSDLNKHYHESRGMDPKTIIYICSGVFVVILLLGCCCRRRRNRGTVLSPAPVTVVTSPAPYPQQQYVVTGPVGYPHPQNAYPSYSPAPAPGPVPPHQQNVYPSYPPAPGPDISHNPPYPSSNYPYQAPYVQQPQPYSSAPSAPDANVFFGLAAPGWNPPALPPSYDQVCPKQPPYNHAAH